MRHTEYYGFPLYDPESSPDLTETGEFDRSVVMIDEALKAEETVREDADTELGRRVDGKQDMLVFATDDDIDSMDYKEF